MSCLQQTGRRCGRSRHWELPQRPACEDGVHRDRTGADRGTQDADSSLAPQIVKKYKRRLTGIDEIVLSLTAKGLTTGEVSAHFQDVYGATVLKAIISWITDKVVGEVIQWQNRSLDRGRTPLVVANRRVIMRGHHRRMA